MAFQVDVEKIAFEASILVSVFLWNFFLQNSRFTIEQLVQLVNFGQTIQSVTSIWFILFIVFFSLSIALICLCARAFDRKEAHIISLAATVVGLVLAISMFGTWGLLIPMVFFVVSIPLMVEITQTKMVELQRFPLMRSVWQSGRRAIGVLAIGLFVSTVILVLPNQSHYVDLFEEGFLELAVNQDLGESGINDQAAELYVNYNNQLLGQLMQTPQFQRLQIKNDPEVIDYVNSVRILQAQTQTPEFKEQIKEQLKQNSASNPTRLLTIDFLKQQSPLMNQTFTAIEQYYWLIAAFIAAGLFSFIGGIIITPLAGLLGWAIGQFTTDGTLAPEPQSKPKTTN